MLRFYTQPNNTALLHIPNANIQEKNMLTHLSFEARSVNYFQRFDEIHRVKGIFPASMKSILSKEYISLLGLRLNILQFLQYVGEIIL